MELGDMLLKGASLEKDLEQVIEEEGEGEEEEEAEANVQVSNKRARRHALATMPSPTRPISPPKLLKSMDDGPGYVHAGDAASCDGLMAQLEAKRAVLANYLDQAMALRATGTEKLQQARRHERETSAALERATGEAKQREDHANAVQESLSELRDLCTRCEKAKRALGGAALEELATSLLHLRGAGEAQAEAAREASSALQRGREQVERMRHDHEERQAWVAQVVNAITRAEEEVQTTKHKLERIATQLKQARAAQQLHQEVIEAVALFENLEVRTIEAARLHDEARSRLAEFNYWSEDLCGFFEGRRVRDGDAIHRGLQALVGPASPMPLVFATMLAQPSGFDRNCRHAVNMYELVNEDVQQAKAVLHDKVASRQTVVSELDDERSKALQRRRHLEEQYRIALNRAGLGGVATPARSTHNEAERSRRLSGGSSEVGNVGADHAPRRNVGLSMDVSDAVLHQGVDSSKCA